MKKNFKNSAAALICLMIMTSGLTGCGGASEKKVSSDSPDSSAESSIVSETSEDNITEKSSDSSAESRAVSETSKDNIPENNPRVISYRRHRRIILRNVVLHPQMSRFLRTQ